MLEARFVIIVKNLQHKHDICTLILTKWAAFIPCAVDSAIRLHLQVVSMLAVQPGNDAFQLWLCKGGPESSVALDRCDIY